MYRAKCSDCKPYGFKISEVLAFTCMNLFSSDIITIVEAILAHQKNHNNKKNEVNSNCTDVQVTGIVNPDRNDISRRQLPDFNNIINESSTAVRSNNSSRNTTRDSSKDHSLISPAITDTTHTESRERAAPGRPLSGTNSQALVPDIAPQSDHLVNRNKGGGSIAANLNHLDTLPTTASSDFGELTPTNNKNEVISNFSVVHNNGSSGGRNLDGNDSRRRKLLEGVSNVGKYVAVVSPNNSSQNTTRESSNDHSLISPAFTDTTHAETRERAASGRQLWGTSIQALMPDIPKLQYAVILPNDSSPIAAPRILRANVLEEVGATKKLQSKNQEEVEPERLNSETNSHSLATDTETQVDHHLDNQRNALREAKDKHLFNSGSLNHSNSGSATSDFEESKVTELVNNMKSPDENLAYDLPNNSSPIAAPRILRANVLEEVGATKKLQSKNQEEVEPERLNSETNSHSLATDTETQVDHHLDNQRNALREAKDKHLFNSGSLKHSNSGSATSDCGEPDENLTYDELRSILSKKYAALLHLRVNNAVRTLKGLKNCHSKLKWEKNDSEDEFCTNISEIDTTNSEIQEPSDQDNLFICVFKALDYMVEVNREHTLTTHLAKIIADLDGDDPQSVVAKATHLSDPGFVNINIKELQTQSEDGILKYIESRMKERKHFESDKFCEKIYRLGNSIDMEKESEDLNDAFIAIIKFIELERAWCVTEATRVEPKSF